MSKTISLVMVHPMTSTEKSFAEMRIEADSQQFVHRCTVDELWKLREQVNGALQTLDNERYGSVRK